jgi:hypothetical protein
LLVYDWLHSVGQNHFYVMMLFNRDLAIQNSFRRFCTVYKSVKSNPLQPSGRCDIPSEHSTVQASSIQTSRTFHPDLPLCLKALNCSSLHPSGRFSSTSRRHSVFYQLWDFFPKHRYGKTAATVRTMWIPIRTRSFLRQVVHSKSRRPDISAHGPNAQASYMKIACIRSTVRTIDPMVRMREALIWKLRAAKVRPSGRGSIQERILAKFWKANLTVVSPEALCLPSEQRLGLRIVRIRY